jgi:hypothetical protein
VAIELNDVTASPIGLIMFGQEERKTTEKSADYNLQRNGNSKKVANAKDKGQRMLSVHRSSSPSQRRYGCVVLLRLKRRSQNNACLTKIIRSET